MEAVVFVLAGWGVISFVWLLILTISFNSEIERLDDDDDRESWKTLNALKAAVRVLEEDDE